MFSLQNIHPLTEFKRNANSYIEQIRETLSPLVLTVNGKAAVVVRDAAAFQSMVATWIYTVKTKPENG